MKIFQTYSGMLAPQWRGYQQFINPVISANVAMVAATGAFTFTGRAAVLDTELVTSVTTYSLTGNAIQFVQGTVLAVSPGAFVLTGNNVLLLVAPPPLVADVTPFVLGGGIATFSWTKFIYRPPTRVTPLGIPYRSLVVRADPEFERLKHREVEYEFDGQIFLADPYQRGSYNRHSNVYPVGQPFGVDDQLKTPPLTPGQPATEHTFPNL